MTNLFSSDLKDVEKVLNRVGSFLTEFSGLELNFSKTKAIWLGKWGLATSPNQCR